MSVLGFHGLGLAVGEEEEAVAVLLQQLARPEAVHGGVSTARCSCYLSPPVQNRNRAEEKRGRNGGGERERLGLGLRGASPDRAL